jgi:hypothetical protein
MIVVHFAKVSALYPWIVISSLYGWLENLLFIILYTSFCVWPRDHYMPLQRSTTWVYHALLQFPDRPPCSAKVSPIGPLPPCGLGVHHANSHSSEHDTQSIVFLISKQAISYRTHGGTCYHGVSSPKIRSLADSSTTCHDGINHLHRSNHCLNHIIDPHMTKSHLHGWKTKSLTLRHKSYSIL